MPCAGLMTVILKKLSLSSLISLKSNNSQSRPDLLNGIIVLYKKILNLGKQVTIVWCPAHIGISGNDRQTGRPKWA
jgi:hypothetical protein